MTNQAIKTIVPDEIYTDRQDFIDLFYKLAINASGRRTMSSVLLGQRRMGKTEIFKRVVNKLFNEQDHQDPKAVIPVYFEFEDIKAGASFDRWDFAISYTENFIRWYAAFKLNDLNLLKDVIDIHQLIESLPDKLNITKGFSFALNLFDSICKKRVVLPEGKALKLPRSISDWDDSTIVIFIDEIQNISISQYQFNIIGPLKNAVESPTCPHFVTGSAMTMLVDILGKGSLYGRFDSHPIYALTDYYGSVLVRKSANFYNAKISQDMTCVISDRCGGNPFYINAVIQRSAMLNKPLTTEKAVNEVLAIDMSSGFIYSELRDQVIKWIERINEYGITKWVLYLAALEQDERIDLYRIQRELKEQDRQDVDIETIEDVLIKLSRGDLIDYKDFGKWFTKINDPILNEFLKVWGEIEVKYIKRHKVERDTVKKYIHFSKKFFEYKGYLAEVYMIQILWNAQKQTLPGKFFNVQSDITVPDRFFYINQRNRISMGQGMEIDIFAAGANEIWLAESKWQDKKVGVDVIRNMLKQKKIVEEQEGPYLEKLQLWLFACNGVTKKAQELIKKHNILLSTKQDLNPLLSFMNLRQLPEFESDIK
ncbi:ATPase domain protein, prokaryote domain protein [Candidatus Magnetomorum sp. HK-1]|nr:ATPase domain protein, prokaryote domain protein [Candidatus Magnetomorum sp. HK-1]